MITKTQLIDTLGQLPEDLSIDQVIDHIIFVEKVSKGIADSSTERVFSKDEAKLKLNKWLK